MPIFSICSGLDTLYVRGEDLNTTVQEVFAKMPDHPIWRDTCRTVEVQPGVIHPFIQDTLDKQGYCLVPMFPFNVLDSMKYDELNLKPTDE